MSKNNGFTLIELLVVVAIIGILSSVVLASLNGARLKARTTRSIEDLNQLRTAIEMYYNDNGSYPLSSGGSGAWGAVLTSPWWTANPTWIVGLVPKYISSLPNTPNNSTDGNSVYAYISNGSDYKLIYHVPEDCAGVKAKYPNMIDPYPRDCWAYGFWTPGGVGF